MKPCPNPNCSNSVPAHAFACSRCWNKMPDHFRRLLSDKFYEVKKTTASAVELDELQRKVRDSLGWGGDADIVVEPFTRRRCEGCGVNLFVVKAGAGVIDLILLEPGFTTTPMFHIIGHQCVDASKVSAGAFAGFHRHVCGKWPSYYAKVEYRPREAGKFVVASSGG